MPQYKSLRRAEHHMKFLDKLRAIGVTEHCGKIWLIVEEELAVCSRDEKNRILEKIDKMSQFPLLSRDMRQALGAIRNTINDTEF